MPPASELVYLALPMGTAHGGAYTGATSRASSDVLTDDNSLPLRPLRQVTVRDGDDPRQGLARCRPRGEIAEKLEWAYRNREKLAEIGARAARDMTRFTCTALPGGFSSCSSPA